jgi:hypothetical protein
MSSAGGNQSFERNLEYNGMTVAMGGPWLTKPRTLLVHGQKRWGATGLLPGSQSSIPDGLHLHGAARS